jgi:methyl-accepting chemotaxis protein-1 (serine sensor receptor)
MSAANDQVRRALYASAKRRYDEANRYFRLFVGASAAATIIGLAVAIISGLTLTGAIMRPLGAALSRFDEIANGDLSRRVVIDRDDEMGRLLTGLARMQTQLAQTVTSVRASA